MLAHPSCESTMTLSWRLSTQSCIGTQRNLRKFFYFLSRVMMPILFPISRHSHIVHNSCWFIGVGGRGRYSVLLRDFGDGLDTGWIPRCRILRGEKEQTRLLCRVTFSVIDIPRLLFRNRGKMIVVLSFSDTLQLAAVRRIETICPSSRDLSGIYKE